jgi:hypothetical protein
VVAALAKALGALFGGDLSGVTNTLRDAMQGLVRAVTLAVGALAVFFGATTFLDRFIASLSGAGPRKDATGLAAVQNTRVTGIETISRDLQAAAARASGRPGEEDRKADPMARVIEELKGREAIFEPGDTPLEQLFRFSGVGQAARLPALARRLLGG